MLTAAQKFNEKPKKGVAFMLENGLVDPMVEEAPMDKSDEATHTEKEPAKRADPKSLARFLKNSPRLDKKVLGEYISNLDNPELLKEFIGMFDFQGVGGRATSG